MLTEILKTKVRWVAHYVGSECKDWLKVKEQILYCLCNEDRCLFSRRHPRTKKHFINEHDKRVMEYWKSITGTQLEVDPTLLHDPNWIYKPKGWALNRKRRANEEH